MRYAFYPGCVARGASPELYVATLEVCERLGIELDVPSLEAASCTGAGVLQERSQRLGDTLNARNLALGERAGLPIMTICSTCQGVMGQAEARLADPEYRESVNADLAEEGLQYRGGQPVRHLLWILLEDYGIDRLKAKVVRPLTGLRIAPFYGCYIVRPEDALGFDENPERRHSLEMVIEAVGAEVADFPGKTACCGFPILTINETNSMKMVSNHTLAAKREGGDGHGDAPVRCATSTWTATSPPPRGRRELPSICRSCTCPSSWGSRWASSRGSCASTSTSSRPTRCSRPWR